MKSSIFWHSGVLVLLGSLLLMGGCIMNFPPSTTTSSTPEIVSKSKELTTPPSATLEITTTDMYEELPSRIENGENSTFVDSFLDIRLDFPEDWHFEIRPDPHSNTSFFYSPCKNSSPDISPTCSKMQISFVNTVYHSFTDLKEYLDTETHLYPLISREVYEVTIDGVSTLWVLTEVDMYGSINKTLRVYILRETGTILINGYGDLTPITTIVKTMHLEDTE